MKRDYKDDIEKQNIKFELINVDEFYNDTKQLNHELITVRVKEVNPGLVLISICFSEKLDLRFALEVHGIFPKMRLTRSLSLATNGKQIELDSTQTKLLYTLAKPENIKKTIVLHGPEGSGKTLLALEAIKMKLSHYIRKQNLQKVEDREPIKVIVCGSYTGNDRVPALMKQLREETQDIRDFCEFELKPVNDLDMSSLKVFVTQLKKALSLDDFNQQQTIVMMDELFPAFTTEEWKNFHGFGKTDFVLALRHTFNDGKCHGIIKKLFITEEEYHSVMEQEGVYEEEAIIACHLRKSYRCTQKLINLAYYMLVHSPSKDKLYKTKSFIHLPNTSQEGETPLWLDVPSVEAFINYSNDSRTLKDKTDVLVVFDSAYDGHIIQNLRGHCIGRGWKARPSTDVMGSEASTVIIFDLPKVHFESVSRAVNHLIFITTTQKDR